MHRVSKNSEKVEQSTRTEDIQKNEGKNIDSVRIR